MTLQDLKDSRNEIIDIISENYGSFLAKEIMTQMVEDAENFDSIDELVSYSAYMLGHSASRRKVSKNATILGRLEQIEIENN